MSTWLWANIFLAEYSLANIRNILAVITCVRNGQPGERDKFNEDESEFGVLRDLPTPPFVPSPIGNVREIKFASALIPPSTTAQMKLCLLYPANVLSNFPYEKKCIIFVFHVHNFLKCVLTSRRNGYVMENYRQRAESVREALKNW